jgi:PAS domain-containing protein
MKLDENEEKLLRSVALQNARAVSLARERAERELRASTERITNILESISDAFVVLDREWCFTYVNPQAEHIVRPLHRSREQLLGSNFWEGFPDLVGTPLEANFRRAVAEKVKVDFEIFAPIQGETAFRFISSTLLCRSKPPKPYGKARNACTRYSIRRRWAFPSRRSKAGSWRRTKSSPTLWVIRLQS